MNDNNKFHEIQLVINFRRFMCTSNANGTICFSLMTNIDQGLMIRILYVWYVTLHIIQYLDIFAIIKVIFFFTSHKVLLFIRLLRLIFYKFKFKTIPVCHLNYGGEISFNHKLEFWLLMPIGIYIGRRLMTKWNEWSFTWTTRKILQRLLSDLW